MPLGSKGCPPLTRHMGFCRRDGQTFQTERRILPHLGDSNSQKKKKQKKVFGQKSWLDTSFSVTLLLYLVKGVGEGMLPPRASISCTAPLWTPETSHESCLLALLWRGRRLRSPDSGREQCDSMLVAYSSAGSAEFIC